MLLPTTIQWKSKRATLVCPHPPYSRDLAPGDFQLFPKVKISMNGEHAESIHNIWAVTMSADGCPDCFQKVARTMGEVCSGGEQVL